MKRRRYLMAAAMVVLAGSTGSAITGLTATAHAHNNPTFREDLLATINVEKAADDGVASQPFELEWDKKTVQLIWRAEPEQAKLKFSIAQDGAIVLEDVEHDQATARLKGANFTLVNVEGAEAPFVIKVFAKVLDRSKKKNN